MLLKLIMVLAALAMSILATPLNTTTFSPSLSKRATPSFKKGDYTAQQMEQITQGHNDAIKMASTVVSWSTSPVIFDPIFRKYFNILDRGAVVSESCPEPQNHRANLLTKSRRLQANHRQRRRPRPRPPRHHRSRQRLEGRRRR